MSARHLAAALSAAVLGAGLLLSGCGNNAISGKGSDSIRPHSAEERMLVEKGQDDMRLGLDRYKGNTARFPDPDGDLSGGLDRENGLSGYDRDHINNWRDYQSAADHAGGAADSLTAGPEKGTTPPSSNGNLPSHDNSRLDHRGDIAAKVAAIPGVRHANVLTSDSNAYVAVFTDYGTEERVLTPSLRGSIEAEVRKLVPAVRHVYVSDEPSFFRRVDEYVRGVSGGKSTSADVDDFNAYLKNAFPLPKR